MEQEETHTPEPWEYIHAGTLTEVRSVPQKANGRSTIVCTTRAKDSERMCIAVNACKGVPSEWLATASLWRFFQLMAAVVPTLTIGQVEKMEADSDLNMADILDEAKVISQQMRASRTLDAAADERTESPPQDIPF